MKTNKVTKLGISLLSVAALGVVAPALTDVPVLGATVVKAEEQQRSINFRISFYDAETGEEIAPEMTGTIRPGESINIHKEISGYQIVSKISWMPNYVITYDMVSLYFHGDPDGYHGMYLDYRKLNTDVKPSETSKPEVKPETKPSDTSKPEVKPETKPSDTPKPEVKPGPAPKDEEKQEPLKYRITYYDIETREMLGQMTGVINPGQTINIYKKFNGHEIISKDSWMPNYDMTYDIVNEYFYGSADGYNDLRLEYKKVEEPTPEPAPTPTPIPTPKPAPTPTPTPEPTPTPTPEPEVKPAPKPSDTSKPEVKPELKPQTNSNTAPTAPVKPVGQTSNSKADKPTSKKETPALPNTGEQSSSLSLVGLLLASLGLAGLTYKGRH
ncbi:LPXTG cell wall anchor domain-containing protein [Streptococcus oralis]|uniref:LPXTG cell wall anchor domain-containing protein n=1 Tax=Streptococcus oralis TaxID=1303 RepID=A0A7T3DZI4_STROR|nr:LPXTG cell wall anchor domain-containing protein [Streptococcus oralis]QPT01131.1 LPXTG cell wall anchor domain-containing protein [Streptococcus oralis]CAK1608601.1 LPXTG cell wall anchor domain-containing protein [Streptococcus oralis subsp. dentisani]